MATARRMTPPLERPKPTPFMHPSIGQQFREARERKGLSLAEAAEITRIKPTQVSAMERGDFSSMAAPLYVKGFIRIYAKTLGLDPGPIIEAVVGSPETPAPGVSPLAPENTTRMLHTRHAPSPALAPPVDRFAPPGEEGSAVVKPPAPTGPRTRSTVHAPLKPAPVPAPASPRPVAPAPVHPAPVSMMARRLSDAQRALNVPRAAVTETPAPPPSTAGFDFPSLAAPRPATSDAKTPAKPAEPDLFTYRPPAPRPEPVPAAVEAPAPKVQPVAAENAPGAPEPAPRPAIKPSVPMLSAGSAAAQAWNRVRREWLPVYGPPVVMAAMLMIAAAAVISAFRSCASTRAERSPALAADAPSGYAAEPPEPFLPMEPVATAPRAP